MSERLTILKYNFGTLPPLVLAIGLPGYVSTIGDEQDTVRTSETYCQSYNARMNMLAIDREFDISALVFQ